MKSTFVVIDPDTADRSRLATALRQSGTGADVIEAAGGIEAMRALDERGVTPSLIFTAYRLPDMNAIELLGRLRQVPWLQHPPAMIVDDSMPGPGGGRLLPAGGRGVPA